MSESEVANTEARWRNYQQLIWTQQQIQLQIQQQHQQYQNVKMNQMEPRTDIIPPLLPSLISQQQSPTDMEEKAVEETTKETSDPWDNFDAHAAFLGPTLWDKRLPYEITGQDFKLEYVDLEEFLTENGIPMDPLVAAETPFDKSGSSGQPSPPNVGNGNACHTQQGGISLESQMLAGPSRILSNHVGSQMRNSVNSSLRSRSPSPNGSSTCSSMNNHDMSPDLSPDDSSQHSEGDLTSVPGHDFDPRTRSFTEDELKPQPMIKKSRKQQFVPDDAKDAKYWARRRKNNMAAKRSRDARRVKENQIAMRACFLEKENMALKQELERVQKDFTVVKEQLRICRRDH